MTARRRPEEVARGLGLRHLPVPVRFVAARHAEVHEDEDLNVTTVGCHFVGRDGTIHIVVNGRMDDTRRRWAVAHALGHVLLHPDRVTEHPHVERSNDAARAPWDVEADRFAAALLMPAELVAEVVPRGTGWGVVDVDVEEAAARFAVPVAAFVLRASQLGAVRP